MFRAADRNTGRERWATKLSTTSAQYFFHSDPVIAGDLVVVGSDAAEGGGVHALERATGQQRWMYPAGRGVFSPITAAGPLAYAVSSEGRLLALDVTSGELRWSFPIDVRGWLAATVADGRVFVGARGGVLYALNSESGRVEWRIDIGAPITTSAVLAGGSVYVGTNDRSVIRVDARHAKVQSSLKVDHQLAPRALAAARDGLLVLLADNQENHRALVSVDLGLAAERWRVRSERPWSTTRLFVADDSTLVGFPTGEVTAYCVSDGRKAWSRPVAGTVRAIGGSNDVLYVGTTQGSLYALPAETSCKAD